MRRYILRYPTIFRSCLALVMTLAGLSGALAIFNTASAVGDCSPDASWGTNRPDFASRIVQLVNEHRVSVGLSELKVSPTLTAAAVWNQGTWRITATCSTMTRRRR